MIHIPSEEIKQPQLHADTLGFTFVWNGHFLRGIFPQSVELAKSYFATGFIDEVIGKGLFPKTWVSEFENEQFGMIIEHDMITPVLYATEWNSAMLKDAALMVLDIAEIGWKYGYNMVDCHKLNVMFKNNQPVYVDLGSFVHKEKGSTGWRAYKNFLESYTYILDMWVSGCPQVAKRMMSPGVTFHTDDYWSWKRPIFRHFPKLLRLRLKFQERLNLFAIMGFEKVASHKVYKVIKSVVNGIKPFVSQQFSHMHNSICSLRIKGIEAKNSNPHFDINFIAPTSTITCINIGNNLVFSELRKWGGNVISLNENDAISNSEYVKNKDITSVSYPLMSGGVLVRGKFAEDRLKSEIVLACCKNGSHGQFARHNTLVYLERCMEYSFTETMYVLLSKPDESMVDILRKKWEIKRISDDGTLIEVNQTH